MRKVAALLIILSLLLLASCATSSGSDGTYSREDCNYTLMYVLGRASTQALSDLFLSMNEFNESMVPTEYAFLQAERYEIPGMDRLLDEWARTTTAFILPVYDSFSDYITYVVYSTEFEDPVKMVSSGASSISEYMLKTRGDEIARRISANIGDMDVSVWSDVAIQYNAWATTRDKLLGENNPRIDTDLTADQVRDIFSVHFMKLFMGALQRAEVLIRTTPDANMDSTAARVLGLD